MNPLKLVFLGLPLLFATGSLPAAPQIPFEPGVTFVLAVSNAGPAEKGAPKLDGVLAGDYEMPIALTAIDAKGFEQKAFVDGFDAKGVHQQGSIPRRVRANDLENAPVQVLGFYSGDPKTAYGTTALGPSLGMTRALSEGKPVKYSFRNFLSQEPVSGTLTRQGTAPVKFSVLVNGARTELDAIRATGMLGKPGAQRPFEMLVLDHPRHPLSLRIAWGPPSGSFPFKADFTREIVRIDFKEKENRLSESLDKDCRVEVPGIYFDFNLATLKSQSERALEEIAAAIRQAPNRAVRIEGHTDNIGTDAYNQDLSSRRAAAVKDALVANFKVPSALLTTRGYGESKPIETNDTLAGRARNRRVELVCAKP